MLRITSVEYVADDSMSDPSGASARRSKGLVRVPSLGAGAGTVVGGVVRGTVVLGIVVLGTVVSGTVVLGTVVFGTVAFGTVVFTTVVSGASVVAASRVAGLKAPPQAFSAKTEMKAAAVTY
jgi:hypothetical protein